MRTQGLPPPISLSTSGIGKSCVSLMVNACEWQRIALTLTQMPSMGTGRASIPRILLASAAAFHSSRL